MVVEIDRESLESVVDSGMIRLLLLLLLLLSVGGSRLAPGVVFSLRFLTVLLYQYLLYGLRRMARHGHTERKAPACLYLSLCTRKKGFFLESIFLDSEIKTEESLAHHARTKRKIPSEHRQTRKWGIKS